MKKLMGIGKVDVERLRDAYDRSIKLVSDHVLDNMLMYKFLKKTDVFMEFVESVSNSFPVKISVQRDDSGEICSFALKGNPFEDSIKEESNFMHLLSMVCIEGIISREAHSLGDLGDMNKPLSTILSHLGIYSIYKAVSEIDIDPELIPDSVKIKSRDDCDLIEAVEMINGWCKGLNKINESGLGADDYHKYILEECEKIYSKLHIEGYFNTINIRLFCLYIIMKVNGIKLAGLDYPLYHLSSSSDSPSRSFMESMDDDQIDLMKEGILKSLEIMIGGGEFGTDQL